MSVFYLMKNPNLKYLKCAYFKIKYILILERIVRRMRRRKEFHNITLLTNENGNEGQNSPESMKCKIEFIFGSFLLNILY